MLFDLRRHASTILIAGFSRSIPTPRFAGISAILCRVRLGACFFRSMRWWVECLKMVGSHPSKVAYRLSRTTQSTISKSKRAFTFLTENVCYWHLADMLFMLANVRFWGQSRRRPTAASQSRFMSTRPSRRETLHVDCQSGTRPGASSATVRAPRESVVKTLATHASAIPC